LLPYIDEMTDDEPYGWEVREEQVLHDAGKWVHCARRRDLLELIAEVAGDYRADETPEDVKRRALTVMWLATRGEQGAWVPKLTPERFLAKRRAGL
jgi:hypothetical protein